MYEKQTLEKWLKQIQNDQINPEALGFKPSKEEAIEQIKKQLNDIRTSKCK